MGVTSGATLDVREQRRWLERHAAASIRALSAEPGAELRGGSLRVDGKRVAMATPFLVLDDARQDALRSRGVADALGLLLRHCDLGLHDRLRPDDPLERIVFDLLEQLRCESLVAPELRGVRRNLDVAFDSWCETVRAERVDESRTAMLVYTVTHMARSRLNARSLPESVDELIETTRGHLAPVIGHAVRRLRATSSSQAAFAEPAGEIARLVAELVGDVSSRLAAAETVAGRFRLAVPADWDGDIDALDPAGEKTRPTMVGSDPADGRSMDSLGDYRVYTRAYDRVVGGSSLYPPERLARLRAELDQRVAAQAVSTPRLAQRLLGVFGEPTDDDWEFGSDHGVLDGRRLAQLVANPSNHDLFRRRRRPPTSHTAVAFLVDNSGSMKRQRYESVAVLVDTFSRALDLAGVSTEVLGFTTGAWTGGRPLADWRAEGRPDGPGRLNENLQIVYQDADTSWRRARASLAAMSSPTHYREGIDGEAVAWAHGRLLARPEPRRVLIVISDGAPNDSATSNANRPDFLADHLRAVTHRIEAIERSGHPGAVELGAIGIDLDVSEFFRRSVNLDLAGTLALHHYRAPEMLFGMGR